MSEESAETLALTLHRRAPPPLRGARHRDARPRREGRPGRAGSSAPPADEMPRRPSLLPRRPPPPPQHRPSAASCGPLSSTRRGRRRVPTRSTRPARSCCLRSSSPRLRWRRAASFRRRCSFASPTPRRPSTLESPNSPTTRRSPPRCRRRARRHWPFVVVVPRWVRLALQCAEGGEANLTIAQLPAATSLHLQPHEDGFAAAVGAAGDPRGLLTELMNRFVAVSRGDVVAARRRPSLHAVDVLEVRRSANKMCGRPPPPPARSTWARRWRRRRPTAPMHRSPPRALWIAT